MGVLSDPMAVVDFACSVVRRGRSQGGGCKHLPFRDTAQSTGNSVCALGEKKLADNILRGNCKSLGFSVILGI